MLSHSHPAYLAYLRLQLETAKGFMDEALLALTIVSILVPAIQIVVGVCSLNVHLPRSNNTFIAFGIVWAISILVGLAVVGLTRFWWVRSKRPGRRHRLQTAG